MSFKLTDLFKKKMAVEIPLRDFVSVRMEAIGGQGANTAGKILAEAAVLGMNYTGNHFSSFGSEKRGTPVKSFVRFSKAQKAVRSASHIKNPDTLLVFHENLLSTHPEVLEGSTPQTDVLINSELSPARLQFPKGFTCRYIATVPATEIARKYQCGLNVVMLGAAVDFLPEIINEKLQSHIKSFFAKSSEQVQEKNEKGFHAGTEKVQVILFDPKNSVTTQQTTKLPEIGWLNAPLGGVITNPGNSVLKDHSSSRKGSAPRLDKEVCFNCGFCDMVCPDFCFVWQKSDKIGERPTLLGIDYQYCKGCQKCITVCPVSALTPTLENAIPQTERQYRAYPDMQNNHLSEDFLKKTWIDYVEHLSEKDQMLSPQTELLNPDSYLKTTLENTLKNTEEWKKLLTDDMKQQLESKKKHE